MSISKTRSVLYKSARILGDIQAATHKKPAKALAKRAGRRFTGSLFASIIGAMFPPTQGK